MTRKLPAPPKPLPPGAVPAPPAQPAHTATVVGPVRLVISAEVTIPATPGYARRLANLIADLKQSVEDQAPWLTDITVEVDRE